MMCAWFQSTGLVATAEELKRLTALLGHATRSLSDFAEETASAWLAEKSTSARAEVVAA
jgi:hypothetical protein